MDSRRIDLHAHTTVSDGTLEPAALVRLAAERGLAALAVTDHDHVAAVAPARREGDRLGVEIVPGVELSAEGPDGLDVHVLGYLLDPDDPALLARLAQLRDARSARVARIAARLQDLGVPVTEAEIRAQAGARPGSLGRPHVARALLARGAVKSVQEAFDRFLAQGRPAYVPKARLAPREAIRLVHAAGGVAVLAHAGTIPIERREALVRDLAREGLDGLEVVHSRHGDDERRALAALAEELGLTATGGSDFHGDVKPDVELGTGREGNVRVGYEVLDALRARRAGARRG